MIKGSDRSSESDAPGLGSRIVILATATYLVVSSTAPYLYGWLLGPLIVLATIVAVLTARRVPLSGLLWAFSLGGLGLWGALHGLSNVNPGAIPTMTIYVAEPLAFGILFSTAAAFVSGWNATTIRWVDRTALAVGAVGLGIVLGGYLDMEAPAWLTGEIHRTVDFEEGIIRTNYLGYGSLAFLAPYSIVRYFSAGTLTVGLRGRLALTAILCTFGVFASGRNILFGAVPVGILIALMARRFAAARLQRGGMTGSHVGGLPTRALWAVGLTSLVVVGVASFLSMSPAEVVNRLVAGATFSDTSGVRAGQSELMLEHWGQAPLLGHGAGGTVPGLVRSAASPWAFELTYHSILLGFGLLGIALLSFWAAWVITMLIRATATDLYAEAALLAGFVGAIIAAIVNPYITQFDGIWMVLLPFGYAVRYREQARREENVRKVSEVSK